MAIPHVLVLAAALVALLCLPCAVAVLICSDDLAVRRAWARRGRADRVALRRLDRELCGAGSVPVQARPGSARAGSAGSADAQTGSATVSAGSSCGGGVAVPIEQLAADLRRLDRQRHSGLTTTSERWAEAVLLAYDERLKLACRYLAVDHHLSAVDGLDRDLERVRVEDELQAAGLDVRPAGRRPEA